MTLSRRSFLQYGSLAAGALAFGFHFPSQKKRLGVALIGLGYYSTDLLAPALQLTEHCYLAGIVTGTPSKIPVWQQKYGIKDANVYNYDNMHEIANNDEIDVLYVVVPPFLHAKYATLAASTGKHVWCEKPMAMNVAECEQIIAACKSNRVSLSIGYRMQHELNTRTVIGFAQSKPYGIIQKVHAEACYAGSGGDTWRQDSSLGGGALYDMGVYCINAIRYATAQEPARVVSARQYANRPELFPKADETTVFELEFASGARATAKTSIGERGNKLRVDAERGWYELEPLQSYNGVKGVTSDGKKLDIHVPNQQARQMDDDALAIMNGTPVMVPGLDGLRDIHIVQKIMESALEGRSVQI